MRRSEMTPELIKLSKRAKELGFPQDVEEGDLVVEHEYGQNIYRLRYPTVYKDGSIDDEDDNRDIRFQARSDHWFLIMEFSRCLEWLREQGCYTWLVGFTEKDTKPLFVHVYRGNEIFEGEGKSIEECGAKAVCKILSEGQEVKILEEEG